VLDWLVSTHPAYSADASMTAKRFIKLTPGLVSDDDVGPFLDGVVGADGAVAGTGTATTPGMSFNFSNNIWLMLMSSLAPEVSNNINEMSWRQEGC